MFSKADTHIHTTYSDGLMTPQEVIDYVAQHTDLSVIAITDHETAEGAFIAQAYARQYAPQLDVIIGQEISTEDGDVVGLFLNSTLPVCKTAAEAIEAIHAHNGLAIAVHPFSRWVSCNYLKGVGDKVFALPFDGIEVRNGVPANVICNPVTKWFNRRAKNSRAELGGSDSHVSFTVGQPYTRFPGRTADDFRWAVRDGTVQAGGFVWSPKSLLHLIPVLQKRGTPVQQHAMVKANQAKQQFRPGSDHTQRDSVGRPATIG